MELSCHCRVEPFNAIIPEQNPARNKHDRKSTRLWPVGIGWQPTLVTG